MLTRSIQIMCSPVESRVDRRVLPTQPNPLSTKLMLRSGELTQRRRQRRLNGSNTIYDAQWRGVIGDRVCGEDIRECAEVAAIDTKGILREYLADLFYVGQFCEFADLWAWEVGR